jgi:hypothetical protein
MLQDKFVRSAAILCELLLGGPFFRKVLVYALITLTLMWFWVGQPFMALAEAPMTSGTIRALEILLMIAISLMIGLVGAAVGSIIKKMIATFAGRVDWIEDLSKRGLKRF